MRHVHRGRVFVPRSDFRSPEQKKWNFPTKHACVAQNLEVLVQLLQDNAFPCTLR